MDATLPPLETARAMRLSVWDGTFFALGVGFGETYFLADAVRLGASAMQVGLVVGLPLCAGAAGALLSLRMLRRATARRPLVVAAAVAQAVTLLAIAAGEAAGAVNPERLIAAICLYQLCGQAAGTGWSSWFGDLVPADERGRYFARRQRWVHLANCVALIIAGLVLYALEPRIGTARGGAGFATIFVVAGALRLASASLLRVTPEPAFRGLTGRHRLAQFLRTDRGRGVLRLLVLGGSLQFVVYLAAPYFTPFMLRELELSYLGYTLATVTVVVVKFATLPAWGRLVDSHGPRPVYASAVFLVALVPLPWLFAGGLQWVVPAQALSGFSWGAFEISSLAMMMAQGNRRTRAQLFATQSVVNGGALLLGGLGGALIVGIGGGADYRLAFAASVLGRILVGMTAARLLPRDAGRPAVGRREILLRAIGFRPDGGLRQRPLDAPMDAD